MPPMYPNARTHPFLAIAGSLLLAFFVLIYPVAPQQAWQRPLLLVVVMLFWLLYQPRYMGLGAAFMLGLLVDMVSQGRLGQHSVLFVLLALWVSVCRYYWYPLTGWRVWLVALIGILAASLAHYLWIAPSVLMQSEFTPPLIHVMTINTAIHIGCWLVLTLLFSRYRRMPNGDE